MHDIAELSPWDRMLKRIVWEQLGEIEGKRILDFGSGEGITANHFANKNEIVAVEPSEEMLSNRWDDYEYKQIVGDVSKLSEFENDSFDFIICHNALEYIDDKEFFSKHAYIYIYTRDEIRLYRIYAAFSTVAGSDVYTLNFPNENSMQNYVTNNAANSAQTPKIVPEKAEHLITLSTCQSSSGDGRNVVLAYLVDTFSQE